MQHFVAAEADEDEDEDDAADAGDDVLYSVCQCP